MAALDSAPAGAAYQGPLTEKYRPRTLDEIRGQRRAVVQLKSWISQADQGQPGQAFVFHGPTGVGKTAAALAMAHDLGCDMSDPYYGGVQEIPSGQQDGAAVDAMLARLRIRPMFGAGWRVAIVNEADNMTKQAEAIWLDGLERLPPGAIVIFTTNHVDRLSRRLASRCESVAFSGDAGALGGDLLEFIREVWTRETGLPPSHLPSDLGQFDSADGIISFRLALQQVAPFIRTGEPLPIWFTNEPPKTTAKQKAASKPAGERTSAARKAWETRRRNAQEKVA